MSALLTATTDCFRQHLADAAMVAADARRRVLALIKPGTIHFLQNSTAFRVVMLLAAVVAVLFAIDIHSVGGLDILVAAWLLISSIAALLFWQPCFRVTFTPAETLACPPIPTLPLVSTDVLPHLRPPTH